MFKSQVGISVKVIEKKHKRAGQAGVNAEFQAADSEQVLIKFDTDGESEMVDVAALQVL